MTDLPWFRIIILTLLSGTEDNRFNLVETKNGTFDEKSSKFRFVPLPEQLSSHFFEDSEKIVKLIA